MSVLSKYLTKQQQLDQLQKELDSLKQDDRLQTELAFKDDLLSLMEKYDKKPKEVIQLLDPNYNKAAPQKEDGRKKRRLKRYTNPHTNHVVETRGGNHKTIRAWKDEHGSDEVERWAEFVE
ncbi:histone-like nucleoid-structuring protein, MvaT/MvaU family [Vreelandella massiliensis]|uniref:histone-like nucleoid-structuring protein, MvaT/MvaU family n=1 Tax=Vreelandella massiliensis TaxID=1816686 RepID=UPI00096A4FFB|nr:histone-like nucleoid-structuring protein, MvaT/MvaU family [Halomonas massiliensis]